MSFGSSGGGGQSSTSRPLTGPETAERFEYGINSIRQALGYPAIPTTKEKEKTSSANNWAGGYGYGGLIYKPGIGLVPAEQFNTTAQPTTVPVNTSQGGATLPFASYVSPALKPYATYQTPSYAGAPGYQAPTAERFGDYAALEKAILESRTAPLERYEQLQREALNQDLANRGIWSSGIAGQLGTDITEAMAPQYRAAGGEAATQRYGLQAQEQEQMNQLAMENALRQLQAGQYSSGAQNAWNLQNALNLSNSQFQTTAAENTQAQTEAQKQYEALWRPLEYLMNLYQGSGSGQISVASGSSPSGFQFSI